jgi:hypothetical protein
VSPLNGCNTFAGPLPNESVAIGQNKNQIMKIRNKEQELIPRVSAGECMVLNNCQGCGSGTAVQGGLCSSCLNKLGNKKKKSCPTSGCRNTLTGKITKSAISAGVMEAVCPGCGVTVTFNL